jgi:hypothetical protein
LGSSRSCVPRRSRGSRSTNWRRRNTRDTRIRPNVLYIHDSCIHGIRVAVSRLKRNLVQRTQFHDG